MRGILTLAVAPLALLTATPAFAHDETAQRAEMVAAVDAFFIALGSDDKTTLARHMIPEAVIFVHNRMDPETPSVDIVPVAKHLEGWSQETARAFEEMTITHIQMDGDMGHVWGPYSFWSDYTLSHCGINSLSLVRTDDGWKVANTSFTMEQPSECERLGVPGFPAEEVRDEGASE